MSHRPRVRSPHLASRAGRSAWEGLDPLEPRTLLAAISWDGGGDGVSWSDAANWSGDTLPGAADDVTIDIPANPTIALPGGVTSVKSLVAAEALTLDGGTLSLAAASQINGAFTLDGTLAGAGKVVVNGVLTWLDGSMEGTGALVVAPSGTFNIANAAGIMMLSRPVFNSGTTNWTGGTVVFNNATFTNVAGRTFNASADESMLAGTGVNTFKNSGTIKKTTSAVSKFDGVKLQNLGTVSMMGGELQLNGGGAHTGDFDLGFGILRFGGVHSLTATSDVTGAAGLIFDGSVTSLGTIVSTGHVVFASGGATFASTFKAKSIKFNGAVANFNGAASAPTITLVKGTVGGSGSLSATVSFAWTGGLMAGTGKTIVANGATMTMSTAATKFLYRQLTNAGTINWTAGALKMSNGKLFNLAGKTISISAAAVVQKLGGASFINNDGVMTKSGSGKLEFVGGNGAVALDITGSFTVQAGTLVLGGGGTTKGALVVLEGATLEFGATGYTIDTLGALSGGGTYVVDQGTHTIKGKITSGKMLELTGGTLLVNGTATITDAEIDGGTIDGSGTVTFKGGASWLEGVMKGSGKTVIDSTGSLAIGGTGVKTLSRTLNNGGAVTWFGSVVTMNGGTFNNLAGKSVTALGSGSFASGGGVNVVNNAGSFVKSGDGTFGVDTGVEFRNPGTLSVSAGLLTLDGAIGQLSGTTLTAGRWTVGAGELSFGGRAVTSNAGIIQIQSKDAVFAAIDGLSFNSGSLDLRGDASLALAPGGGKLTNNGTISLVPGTVLDITGDYTQGASGTLATTIAGTEPENFGLLAVSGQAALGGEVKLLFTGAGTLDPIQAGDQVTFLTCGSRLGSFATETLGTLVGLTATINYISTGVLVEFS